MASLQTDRDLEILATLARRVRVLSTAQVARTWWRASLDAIGDAQARLSVLAEAGCLELASLFARPELAVSAPLATWQPGLPCPDLGAVAYCLQSRWTEPARPTRCVVASNSTGTRYGGRGGRFPRGTEVTHDLHLARVYLLMREELPIRAASWEHEDVAPRLHHEAEGEKVPDAIVRDGLHRTAIEWAGAYPKTKLLAFHAYCDERRLAYELW